MIKNLIAWIFGLIKKILEIKSPAVKTFKKGLTPPSVLIDVEFKEKRND